MLRLDASPMLTAGSRAHLSPDLGNGAMNA